MLQQQISPYLIQLQRDGSTVTARGSNRKSFAKITAYQGFKICVQHSAAQLDVGPQNRRQVVLDGGLRSGFGRYNYNNGILLLTSSNTDKAKEAIKAAASR